MEDAEKALREGVIDLYPILTVSPERRQSFYISVPWWEASLSLLSLREHPLKSPAAAAGHRIALRDRTFETAAAASQLPGALTVPTRGALKMIGDLCTGRVEGALMDARLIYGALLDQPAACANHPLLVVPLPQTSLPMATFARRGVKTTARQAVRRYRTDRARRHAHDIRQPVVRSPATALCAGSTGGTAASRAPYAVRGSRPAVQSPQPGLRPPECPHAPHRRRGAGARPARRTPVRGVHGTHAGGSPDQGRFRPHSFMRTTRC